MKNLIPLLLLFLLFVGCNSNSKGKDTSTIQVDSMTIGNSIKILASDDFQGRKPFTEGEEKTTAYLKEQFSKLGLQPGNGDSYFQEVPMVAITGTPSEKMKISGNSKNIELQYFEDFVAVTRKTDSVVDLNNSELVFAGYGIVAPEYGWNDYKGID
ncbi:hypothetical protein [Gillisia sp. JM1]|uniref:hypothetical protein n=1 Tax=Gillisia sp. JM1 TaxID=1283286 RepID=UPI001E54E0B2|nr:hypothetical protein [Gillisia sp. JM1]